MRIREWWDDDAIDAIYAVVHLHAAIMTGLLLVAHVLAMAVHFSRVRR